MAQLRNDYSKALGFGMTYSDKLAGSRRMTWRVLGFTEAQVRQKLADAGLDFADVKVTVKNGASYFRGAYTNHYVRVYI